MFKATITFNDQSQSIVNNPQEFTKLYFERFGNLLNVRDYCDISSVVFSGMIADTDINRVGCVLKKNTDILCIKFDCYQIKRQHQDIRAFALSKEALKNFLSMMGVHESGINAGVTHYSNGFAWEISKTSIII